MKHKHVALCGREAKHTRPGNEAHYIKYCVLDSTHMGEARYKPDVCESTSAWLCRRDAKNTRPGDAAHYFKFGTAPLTALTWAKPATNLALN